MNLAGGPLRGAQTWQDGACLLTFREAHMIKSMDKMLLAGLGAMNMTRKKAEEIFDDLVRQGQAARGGKGSFIKEMVDTAQKARKDLEDTVARQVRTALAKGGLASRDDVERLEKKLDQALRRKTRKA
jgi:polyhydroxyalkanoate synthesis regulator phasin